MSFFTREPERSASRSRLRKSAGKGRPPSGHSRSGAPRAARKGLLAAVEHLESRQLLSTLVSGTGGNWNSASTWAAISETGTISCSTNSTTVTGTSTSFGTSLAVGSIIPNVGTVQSIRSNSSLTLTADASTNLSRSAYTAQVVPGSGDSVTIAANTGVTVDSGLNPTVATLIVNGTLTLGGNALTTGSLTGSGSITSGSATGSTVTINGTTTQAFAGTISDTSGTDTTSLVMSGTGVEILTGANTYSGKTTVNSGGTIQIGSGGSSGRWAPARSLTMELSCSTSPPARLPWVPSAVQGR